jgi:hypothetical protein
MATVTSGQDSQILKISNLASSLCHSPRSLSKA